MPCQEQHGQLKSFPHRVWVSAQPPSKKWFRIIFSATVGVDGWCSLRYNTPYTMWLLIFFFWWLNVPNLFFVFHQGTKETVMQVMKRWHFYRDCSSLRQWKTCLESKMTTDMPALNLSVSTNRLGQGQVMMHLGHIKKGHLWKIYNCYMFI